MRKLIILVLIAVVQIQVGVSQEITTTNLYTLKEGEQIMFEDEHSLRMYNKESTSIIFTKRAAGHYFIYNGKENGPYDTIHYPGMYDYEKHGRFSFTYENGGKQYCNINGKSFGPYHELGGITVIPSAYSFNYQREDKKWMLHINGKEHGPFDQYTYARLKNDNVAYTIKKADGYYVNIDGKEVGPYDVKTYVTFMDDGKYKYSFKKEGKYYYNYNGREYGPYTKRYTPSFNDDGDMTGSILKEDGHYLKVGGKEHGPFGKLRTHKIRGNHYAVVFYKDFKYHVVVDGNKIGTYTRVINSISLSNKGKYMFYYNEEKKDYVNFNGKVYGPYDDAHGHARENSWFMVSKEADGKYHLHINGKEKLKSDKRIYPSYDDQDRLSYNYKIGDQYYKVKNGKTYGPSPSSINSRGELMTSMYKKGEEWYYSINGKEYKGKYRYFLSDKTGEHYLAYHYYRSDYKDPRSGLMIDGKSFPNELGFSVWYEEAENSFRWITLEGRSLVVKEFKLN
jgi:hypothetical protein